MNGDFMKSDLMSSIKVSKNLDLSVACNNMLKTLKNWADMCIREFSFSEPNNSHDQLTYTVGFAPLYKYQNDEKILTFMKNERDKMKNYFEKNGEWLYGYWKKQEAHHGTEHFDLFIRELYKLDKNDEETIKTMTDVANIITHENENVPKWYNSENNLFNSMFLGSQVVGESLENNMNVPEHLRIINLILLAYEMTENKKYLEFSERYMEKWTSALLTDIPLGVNQNGSIYAFEKENEQLYRSFVEMMPSDMNNVVDKTENIFASEGVDVLLYLYKYTKNDVYLKCAENLIDVLVSQICDVDAGSVCGVIRMYRNITGKNTYDKLVIDTAKTYNLDEIDTISLEPCNRGIKKGMGSKESGIGKRVDLSLYYENDKSRKCNPLVVALAAEIQMDKKLAAQAVNLASSYLQLAIEVYPSGRHHGCCATSVSAIARGHGREDNFGMVTAVLDPIMSIF